MLKKAPQIASRWPSWPQLGSSWRHLGSKLAPSCPMWTRFWSIRARPKLTKISQDSFWEIFCLKVAPKSSQTPSRPPPDLDFSSFQVHFSKVFVNFSKHLFIDSALKVYSFLNTFSLIFFGSVPLESSRREGGGGTRPQGVFDIYIYIYIYILIYIYIYIYR